MLVSEILTSCEEIIQDGAYQEDEITAILDQVVFGIGSLVRIPSSKKIGSVTINATDTSTNIKDSFSDFAPLYCDKVWNTTTGKFVKVYGTLELLFADYPAFDEEGDIEAVAFEDYMLWTQKVSDENQALNIIYYTAPPAPSVAGDISWCPAGLHYNLLVCGVVAQCFGELEDGFEMADGEGKPNTGFFAARFFKGLKDYRNYIARYSTHRLSSFWSV